MVSLGRPREFDRTAALDAAMQVFWRQGFQGASLDDLLLGMGIGRSSFYAAFGSKQSLFQEALHHYGEVMLAGLQRDLATAPSARAFIEAVLLLPAVEAGEHQPRGCLLMNSAAEFGTRERAFCQDVQESLGRFERLFADAIRRGHLDGSIARSADPDALGRFLSSSLGGMRTMARGGTSAERLRAMVPYIMKSLT
jgi:AcrR family transcriptional regulator